MADPLSQAVSALAGLPKCAQSATLNSIAKSPCGVDIACVCSNLSYGLIALQLKSPLVLDCSPADLQATWKIVPQICGAAVPSLRDSRTSGAVASIVATWALAFAALILRLISRKISTARFGMDDYLIIAAMIFATGVSTSSLVTAHYGFGKHMIMLSFGQITPLSKASFAVQILFAVSISAAKISILYFYRRVFPVRTVTILSIVIGALVIAWSLALIFLIIFNCKPIAYFWDKSIPGGQCINTNVMGYCLGAINTFTDIVVLVLPIPWLAGLHMDLTRKLALVGTFIIGAFACVAGILRTLFIKELKQADLTWTITHLAIWINVECNIGIVCACLPVMQPLLHAILPASVRARLPNSRQGGQKWTLRRIEDGPSMPSSSETNVNGSTVSLDPWDYNKS